MQDLFVALIAVSVGLVAVFFGYRLFRAVLPVFGFVLGAIVGAQAVNLIFGDGIFVDDPEHRHRGRGRPGVRSPRLRFWALGVILVVGGMGFAIGSALLPAFGLDADVISWVIGAAVALGFAAAAFVLRLPRAIVTVVTALWGAGATLGGVMVLLQIIEPEELGFGGVDAVVSESFLWLLAFIALAVVGAIFQAMTTAEIDTIWLDESTTNIAAPSRPPGG